MGVWVHQKYTAGCDGQIANVTIIRAADNSPFCDHWNACPSTLFVWYFSTYLKDKCNKWYCETSLTVLFCLRVVRIIRTRLKVLYYGAFRPFLFEGRQPICIEKNKNHHKSISLRSKDFKTSGFLTGQGTKRSPYCRMDEAFNTEPAEIHRFKTEFGYFALP